MTSPIEILQQITAKLTSGLTTNFTGGTGATNIDNTKATSSDVLSIIESNVSRQNQFEVQISIPQLDGIDSAAQQTLNYYIQDASLPSQQLSLVEANYMGKEIYAYLNKATDSVIFKFYDTKEQVLKNLFWSWQTAIVPNSESKALKYYPSQYQTKILIKVHNKEYTLEGASPLSIGDFVLSHTAQDSLGTFDVTMKIRKVV